jgi:hypothetical protein
MSQEEQITPEKCRERAKQLRDMARTENRPENRKQFEDIAAAWAQLCEELELMAKRKKH